MKQSSDFRRIALDSLRGRWSAAVLAGFVTALLGSGGGAPLFGLNIDMSGPDISATFNGKSILSASGLFGAENSAAFLTAMPLISMAVIVFCIFYFIIGSCVNVGYARFNMNLVDGNNAAVENLFAHFGRWKTIALTKLLENIYVFLWSLLLLIPGIVKSYSYAMTSYILADNPALSPSEAIRQSELIMKGNKMRLFCLHFSFLLWSLLSVMTLGIGFLWLTPYMNASTAAFYREVSDTENIYSHYGY